jgi:hypothetical protein
MEPPPFSPDLAASHFHTFGPMKEALRRRRFSFDEVIVAVENWLKTRPKTFLVTELKTL